MAIDIERFIASDDAFALKFRRSDLPGLWGKKLALPAGHLALLRQGGTASVLEGPAETAELDAGVLVKSELKFDLTLDGGRSQDNLPFVVTLGLSLRPRDKTIDLGQLEQTLLRNDEASCSDVRGHFEPYVRDAVRFFVDQRHSEGLVRDDQRTALDEHLRQQLQKPLFETGLELVEVSHPKFVSEEYDARVEADLRADAQAKQVEREREVLELKKQLDKEALLAGIEIQDEADRTRKERRLERYEEIRSRMGDDDLKALVMLIEDDDQRSLLIKELIEKDMTPEQRSGIKVSEMEARVEERLKELQAKLAALGGGDGLQRDETDLVTRRVLAVVGKRILAFDPKTNLHPEVPKEVYETEEGSLGYLRSVRSESIAGDDYLLVGAQRGAYKINGSIRVEYTFPSPPQGKGGTNAVAYFDGRIFATHSEVGLVEWPMDNGTGGRLLCKDALSGSGSIRGAQVHHGKLYFSAGAEVFSLDIAAGSETPIRFKGSDDSITSFTVVGDEVVAGNRSGKMYRWTVKDPNSPEAFNVVKKNPIFMLRSAQIAGQQFFIIGSKEFTVSVAEPRKDLFREYQSREEVRWVDGAGDYIFGVSRSGRKLFCWDTLRQTEPKLTIRVSDNVQDLFVVKDRKA